MIKECYRKFGANEDGYVLKDDKGNLFEGADFDFYRNRVPLEYVKAVVENGRVKFTTKAKK